ncbi:MAG: alpha-L-fucosidase [Fuerstiella sp.]
MNHNKLMSYVLPLLLASGAAQAEERVLHPNWRPRTIDLRHDNITPLMAYRAELSGTLTHNPIPTPFANLAPSVFGFTSSKDTLTWTVHTGQADDYAIALICQGENPILSKCRFEVACGTQKRQQRTRIAPWSKDLRVWPRFQRHWLDHSISLKRGENKISFRLTEMPAAQKKTANLALERGLVTMQNETFMLYSIELVRPDALKAIRHRARELRADAGWMIERKYGLFVHWSPQCYPLHGETRTMDRYQQAVDEFDVEAFADVVEKTGAGWVCFTTSHGPHYWPAPSQVIDRILPGRTCRRDLIAELADALGKRNVRLLLYYNWGLKFSEDRGRGWSERDWPRASGILEADPKRWEDNMEAFFKEVSLRYGDRIGGFGFIDASHVTYQYAPPWERFVRAIKAGNPNNLVGFSPGRLPSVTPFNELEANDHGFRLLPPSPKYLFGEEGQLGDVTAGRWMKMDEWIPRLPYNGRIGPGPRHQTSEYIAHFQRMAEANVPITINLLITQDVTRDQPFFNPKCLAVMEQIRKTIHEE